MKWSMDTHKYISEITRKALQIMVKHGISSESEAEELVAKAKEEAQVENSSIKYIGIAEHDQTSEEIIENSQLLMYRFGID